MKIYGVIDRKLFLSHPAAAALVQLMVWEPPTTSARDGRHMAVAQPITHECLACMAGVHWPGEHGHYLGDIAACDRGLHVSVWAEERMAHNSNTLAATHSMALQHCSLQAEVVGYSPDLQDSKVQHMLKHINNISNMPSSAASEPELDRSRMAGTATAVGQARIPGLQHMCIGQDKARLAHHDARSPPTPKD